MPFSKIKVQRFAQATIEESLFYSLLSRLKTCTTLNCFHSANAVQENFSDWNGSFVFINLNLNIMMK